jgi:hypothetical protein
MIADIVGITGMTFLIVAYFLILFKKIRSDGYLFYFSNLIGALLLFTNALMIGVPWFYPLINTVWATGTVYQIISKYKDDISKYKDERYIMKILTELLTESDQKDEEEHPEFLKWRVDTGAGINTTIEEELTKEKRGRIDS